jgi:hypothetical protein
MDEQDDDTILGSPLKPQPVHIRAWSPRAHVCADVTLPNHKIFSVRSIIFKKDDPLEDFRLMIKNPFYTKNTLFIINENFLGWRNPTFNNKGGGTAVIRLKSYPKGYKEDNLFVAGVVTGWSAGCGGFATLGYDERRAIDASMHNIRTILRTHPEIDNVVFASDPTNRNQIGEGIFQIHDEVKQYISQQLHELTFVKVNDKQRIASFAQVEKMACFLDRIALLLDLLSRSTAHLRELHKDSRKDDDYFKRLLNETRLLTSNYSQPYSQWGVLKRS